MEELQNQRSRSSYAAAGTDLHDVNVRTINNNLWVGRSKNYNNPPPSNYYDPSRYRCVKTVRRSSDTWWWNDPDRKRKRRVAKYKLYAAEGKCKHSVKKGWRWFKIKCIKIITRF